MGSSPPPPCGCGGWGSGEKRWLDAPPRPPVAVVGEVVVRRGNSMRAPRATLQMWYRRIEAYFNQVIVKHDVMKEE